PRGPVDLERRAPAVSEVSTQSYILRLRGSCRVRTLHQPPEKDDQKDERVEQAFQACGKAAGQQASAAEVTLRDQLMSDYAAIFFRCPCISGQNLHKEQPKRLEVLVRCPRRSTSVAEAGACTRLYRRPSRPAPPSYPVIPLFIGRD